MANQKAKILLFDIETSPLISYTWGMWEQNVIKVAKEWELLSFAYKFHGDANTKCVARSDFKDKTEKSLVEALWKVMDDADIIVAHNGDAFDIKKANAKFIQHKLTPPTSYKKIDTKKIAKLYFKFTSNSLNELAKFLGIGQKVQTGGFDLWLGCMSNDKKSWDLMKKYNKQDVVLLEKVYLRFLPWIHNHPNVSQIAGKPDNCPKCGSSKLRGNGFEYRQTMVYRRFLCTSCGGTCRASKGEKREKPNIVNI